MSFIPILGSAHSKRQRQRQWQRQNIELDAAAADADPRYECHNWNSI